MSLRIDYVYYHRHEEMPIHTREVVEALRRHGHDVRVVTAISRRYLQELGWQGRVPVVHVPILRIRGCRSASFMLAQAVLLPWRWIAKRPHIVYARFSLTTAGTLLASRALRIPLVVEVNGIVEDELRLGRAPAWRIGLQRAIERAVFRGATRLVTVTDPIRRWIHATYGVPLERMAAIPNATNPERFRPVPKVEARARWGLAPDQPVVGYLGSLFPWCGLDTLIEAAPAILRAVPQAFFLIGGGQEPLKSDLQRMVQVRGLADHFRFAGQIGWNDAASFISAFDIAVAPARFADNRSGISPQKVYGYLACERPVIGTDIEGLGDVLEREQVGRCIPAGSAAALGSAAAWLLQHADDAQAMGKRGRALVLRSYTWDRVAEATLETMRPLLAGAAR